MPSWSAPSGRASSVLVALCLVGAACAPTGEQASLVDTRGAEETAAAVEVLAEASDTEALPTPSRPELFGLDPDDSSAVPEGLAFELDEPEPLPPPGDGPTDPPADGPVQTEDAPGAGDPEAGDPDAESDPGATDAESAEPDDEPDEQDDVGQADPDRDEPPAPPPPPAVAGPAAPYDDPSELVITASGRPFVAFGDDEATDRGVTGTTIRVGGLATETLAGNPYRDTACLGAEARFDQANHHGELSRRIEFVGCYDDSGRADLTDGLLRSLVRDEVFGVVPLASPSFFSEDVAAAERVPFVGDERLPGFCGRTNPLGFGIAGAVGCPVLDARGFVTLVEPVLSAYAAAQITGDPWTKLTYAVPTGASGQTQAASRAFEAELLAVPEPRFVAALPAPGEGSRSNWTSTVSTILDGDPAVLVLDGADIEGLPAALRAAGFTGELVIVGAVDPVDVADADWRAANGPMTVITPGSDPATRTSRGWVALEGALRAVGVDADEIDLDVIAGYLSADFLVRALAATPEPLTVERLADTVNGGWWYPGVDGVGCGSWWPASHFIASPCVSVARVDVFAPGLQPVLGLVQTTPQIAFNLDD